MVETQLVEAKELRQQVINNTEVLNKVKKLFLIPEMNSMTMKMIADYYEVDIDTIKKCYQRNKSEIQSDGVLHKRLNDMAKQWKGQDVTTVKKQTKIIIAYQNITIEVPNAGVLMFSQRAILRIGMLLRDSIVAQEVRTQLLNTFEHSTDEQKTMGIDEELRLKTNIGIAYASGDMDAFTRANIEYNSYKNRYIEKIENENIKLTNLNKELETTNALLTRKTMEWGNKPILNALIKKYALVCFSGQYRFPSAWKALYRQVKYRCGWDIEARSSAEKLIDRIKEKEFPEIVKVAVGLCEANHIDIGKTINGINAENIKKYQ